MARRTRKYSDLIKKARLKRQAREEHRKKMVTNLKESMERRLSNLKLILVVTMHDEIEYGPHVWLQMDDALEMGCFDEIFVLDDGSTDGTWDVLKEYSNKHNHIHVFRNEKNSIFNHGENRWVTIYREAAKVEPTWVQVRAADVLDSCAVGPILRERLIELDVLEGANIIRWPYINLWRSEYWQRVDGRFGDYANKQHITPTWKFHKNYSYESKKTKAGYHIGSLIPTTIGHPKKYGNINENSNKPFKYVKLHYGHTSHEKKVVKFRKAMEYARLAAKIGLNIGMPIPEDMPPLSKWCDHNSYLGFYEFGMKLIPVEPIWFKDPVPNTIMPVPISLYEVVREFNSKRAEEYKKLYEKHYEAIIRRRRINAEKIKKMKNYESELT